MAFLDGDNYTFWIESATAGTFNKVKGQRELALSSQMATYSRSTKDSATDLSGPAALSYTLTHAFMPDLPDATGATRLKTLHGLRSAIRVQIRGPADYVMWDCVMLCTNLNTDYPFRDGVGVQATLVPTLAPTVNELSVS